MNSLSNQGKRVGSQRYDRPAIHPGGQALETSKMKILCNILVVILCLPHGLPTLDVCLHTYKCIIAVNDNQAIASYFNIVLRYDGSLSEYRRLI